MFSECRKHFDITLCYITTGTLITFVNSLRPTFPLNSNSPQHRPPWLPWTSRAWGRTPERRSGFELEAAPLFHTLLRVPRSGLGNFKDTQTLMFQHKQRIDRRSGSNSSRFNNVLGDNSNRHNKLKPCAVTESCRLPCELTWCWAWKPPLPLGQMPSLPERLLCLAQQSERGSAHGR